MGGGCHALEGGGAVGGGVPVDDYDLVGAGGGVRSEGEGEGDGEGAKVGGQTVVVVQQPLEVL